MKSIYSCASTVQIWLGEAADASDEVMQAVQLSSRDHPTGDQASCHAFLRRIQIGGRYLVTSDYAASSSIFDYVSAFFGRAWWTRVWILQETLLAKKAIMHCGNCSLPLEDFFSAENNIRELMGDPFLLQGHGGSVSHYFDNLATSIATLRFLRRLHQSVDPLERGVAALSMLALGWNFEATDPRDKIYGMFGILDDLWCHVPVHYEWTIERVYIHYALQIMATAQSLSILSYSSPMHNRVLQLPSWVPDWSVVDRNVCTAYPPQEFGPVSCMWRSSTFSRTTCRQRHEARRH